MASWILRSRASVWSHFTFYKQWHLTDLISRPTWELLLHDRKRDLPHPHPVPQEEESHRKIVTGLYQFDTNCSIMHSSHHLLQCFFYLNRNVTSVPKALVHTLDHCQPLKILPWPFTISSICFVLETVTTTNLLGHCQYWAYVSDLT